MADRSRLATLWVAPLTLVVHLAGVRPGLLGSWTDDAIYVELGRSLARGAGLVVPLLPGAPEVAKYPPGWPIVIALVDRLGVDLGTEAGLQVLLSVNALLWALGAQVVVDGLLPRLGASLAARVAVGLMLAVNTVSMQLVGAAMSEPLFTLALVTALTLAWDGSPAASRWRLPALAVAVAVAGLTRSVGAPLALVGLGLAVLARRRLVALAIGAGWALQAALVGLQRGRVALPPEDALPVLHYFVSYGEHTAYYTDPLRAGQLGQLLERVAGVLSRNGWTAPRALAGLFLPIDYVGEGVSQAHGPMTALGVGALLLAAGAAVRTPKARPLVALLAAYAGVFLLWTWPFSTRFWLPAFPLLAACVALTLSKGGNVGRALLWPLVLVLVAWNGVLPWYRIQHRIQAPDVAQVDPGEAALDEGTAWLASRAGPQDVLLGDRLTVWVAVRLGTRAAELAAMLRSEDHLGLMLGLVDPRAEAVRLARDLDSSLRALDRMLSPDAVVWIPLAASAEARTLPMLERLTAEGALTFEGQHGALRVWRLQRQRPPAPSPPAPSPPAPDPGGPTR